MCRPTELNVRKELGKEDQTTLNTFSFLFKFLKFQVVSVSDRILGFSPSVSAQSSSKKRNMSNSGKARKEENVYQERKVKQYKEERETKTEQQIKYKKEYR